MKKKLLVAVAAMLVLTATVSILSAGGLKRKPTIEVGADRLTALQRVDAGWEGTWYWYVGSTYNATNLTGVTALALLEAHRDTGDQKYLDAAVDAADFITTHLGAGATGTQYHVRATAPDVVFLHRLGRKVGGTDGADYIARANLEWQNITATYPTAASMDTLFRSINRPSTWDIAFFLEAAHMSGDVAWADDAAAILADTSDTFYYGTTWWYALNVAGALRALVDCDYVGAHSTAVYDLRDRLIAVIDDDNSVDGYIQDTAYAILALNTVGGAVQEYANELGRWLTDQLNVSGGWLESGYEYPEINGEAVRALASTNGTTVTLDGFEPGKSTLGSSWIKPATTERARPFND